MAAGDILNRTGESQIKIPDYGFLEEATVPTREAGIRIDSIKPLSKCS
jgi:hypothetical protein